MSPSQGHGVAATIHLTEQNLDKALVATQGLVMVDFWAEWCGPCRAIAPVLEELAEASEGRVTLMKVNVDENPGLAVRYGIRSSPTLHFLKQGAVVARGAHLEAMQRRGLTLRTPDGDSTIPVTAVADTRTVGAVDFVLFRVKSYDTESAA